MSKGEQTREMILVRTAPLFNQQGYFGASLSDIMRATGLEKGGIYNHFASKEQLALEAFDFAYRLVAMRVRSGLVDKKHAIDRLYAIIAVFLSIVEDPPVPGGCPVLNTAIEADDAHKELRERARSAMNDWRSTIQRIVQRGIERHEIRHDINADEVATLFIATLEGAIMLSNLYKDAVHIHRAAEFMRRYIETDLRVEDGAIAREE